MADEQIEVLRLEGDDSSAMSALEAVQVGLESLTEWVNELAASAPSLDEANALFAILDEQVKSVGQEMANLGIATDQAVSSIQAGAQALSEEALALQEAGQGVTDYMTMLDALGASGDAAVAGLTSVSDAAAMASVAMSDAEVNALGLATALETEGAAGGAAGGGTTTAGDAAMGGRYQMMMLAMMLTMVARGFLSMGAEAQTGMEIVHAFTGASTADMTLYTNSVEAMALQFGESMTQMSQGLYYIISAGFSGSAALTVLKYSTMAAAASGAQFQSIASGVTSVLNAYNLSGMQAGKITDEMTAAVVAGKQTYEQFSSAIGVAAVTGAALGVSFNQIAAAEADMTDSGLQAHRAVMDLDFMLRKLFSSVDTEAAAAQKMGLSFDKNAYASDNLIQRLQYLQQISKGNQADFTKLVGGANGFLAAQILLTGHSERYNSILQQINKSSGDTAHAFAITDNTVSGAAHHMGAELSVLAYHLIQAATPILVPMFHAIATAMQFIADHASQLAPILAALGIIFGGILLAAIGALIGMFGGLIVAMGPVLPIILGLAAAVGLTILIIQHWGQITQWVGGIFSWLGTHVHEIMNDIGSFVGSIFNAIGTTIRDALTGVKNGVGGAFDWIGTKVHDALTGVKNGVGGAFDAVGTHIHDALTGIKDAVGGAFDWLYNHNYYWKAIVDAWPKAMKIAGNDIRTILTDIKNFIGGVFSAIGTFIHDRLTWIKDFVGAIFSAIGTFIHDRLTWIHDIVGSIFNAIGTFIHGVLSAIASFIGGIFSWIGSLMSSKSHEAGNAVGDAFSRLGTAVHNILSGLGSWLANFFGNLAGAAFSWGANFIGGLINGIKSMVGGLFSQVGSIAHNITSLLGFHSPPETGPMHDADQWMPRFGDLLTSGLRAQAAKVGQASLNVAASISGAAPSASGVSSYNTALAQSSLNLAQSSSNSEIVRVLMQILVALQQQQGTTRTGIGASPLNANYASVNQYNTLTLSPQASAQSLYQQLNVLAGRAAENGLRGAPAGLG